tara:strand:- start:148 stop:426 length:279 start_codon:yes stop_codon:yes gene_type:complete
MKTESIKKGMVVELRSGNHGIVMENNDNTLEIDIRGENATHTVRACDVLIVWPEVNLKCGTVWDYTDKVYDIYQHIDHNRDEIAEYESTKED